MDFRLGILYNSGRFRDDFMNEQYLISEGKVVVSGNRGIRKIIPYTDNIIEILKLENICEFLETRLESDEKKLEKKKEERNKCVKDYKRMSLIGAGVGIAATTLAFPLFTIGIDASREVNSILGNLPFWQTYFLMMLPTVALVSQSFSIVGFACRPSKRSVLALEVVVSYEKALLETVSDSLAILKSNEQITDLPDNASFPKTIFFRDEIQQIKDAIKLRYYSVMLEEEYYELYKNGLLESKLIQDGYDEEVVKNFMEFLVINEYFDHYEVEGKILKKLKNI